MHSQVNRRIYLGGLNWLLWLRASSLLALAGAGVGGLGEPVLATLPPELLDGAPLITPTNLTGHVGSERFAEFLDRGAAGESAAATLPAGSILAQTTLESSPATIALQQGEILETPSIRSQQSQAAYPQAGDESSIKANYPTTSHSIVEAGVDLTSSNPFSDSPRSGLDPLSNSANLAVHVGRERFAGFSDSGTAENPAAATSLDGAVLAQATSEPPPSANVRREGSAILGRPSIQLQGVYKQEGDESSARARVTATYAITPHSMFGAVVDLTSGNAFADSPQTGLDLSELYFTTSPANLPELRFVVGLMDLTSYFDRNSFAKDGASQFFNLAFQTNPALSAAGISSRIGVLANWNLTDNLEAKVATFSASRDLSEFAFDSFAGELGVRLGPVIVRGTYVSSKDAGQRTGFREIFQFPRDDGFGLASGDRETAYGINAEVYIPQLKMGLFGRYGRYDNMTLGQGGDTYSFGVTWLDLFGRDDRLGVGYGRQLSNEDLRRDADGKIPDVLEVYYDLRVSKFLRAGVMVQQRNEFSETVFGFRIKTEFDVSPRGGAR